MENENLKTNGFDSSELLVFFYKYRKELFIVTFVSLIVSIIVSFFFITPKYKSQVIMFPTSTNAISKALLADNFGNKNDILEFGEEEQSEQLLQVLNSYEIRDRVIKKYNLMQHYNIDSTSKYKNTLLFEEYEENIKFRRTEFMAVEITVLDKDPQMAADMANDIAALLDTVKNKMKKERAIQGYKIVETEYKKLVSEIKLMEDSMTVLRKYGVHDYETQSQVITEQLAIAISKNNSIAVKSLRTELQNLAKYAGPYVSIRDALEHEKKQLSLIKSKYEEAKVDADEVLSNKFIVSKAYKAEKKSYPVRWLIVLISTTSTFIFSLIIIVLYEKLKKLNILQIKSLK